MQKFEMVAKTLQGLEEVLAEELRQLGAEEVEPGRRMVSFVGDLAMLYKANLCCRTALRVLKPFYKFQATTPDELYDKVKEYDWSTILDVDKTFCIDSVVYSEDFTHSQFVTYRVKDGIVDWFRDRYADKRPGVRLADADIMINVHISAGNVTLSLDSSGESLHKRGYRVAQTQAPINEVLAAGIILMSGYRGEVPFVDPMCGSGTFLIEAAMIAANINPGVYRKSYAFESWPDFDKELFERLYNDDSGERPVECPIIGADISPAALAIAERNIKSAGVAKYVQLERRPLAHWEEAPQPAGILVTNPPYGERLKQTDLEGLYATLGNRLKTVFPGYHAWVIGYRDEYFHEIGLAASQKISLYNGSLECELREYILFEGDRKSFLAQGGKIKEHEDDEPKETRPRERRNGERRDRRDDGRPPRGRREGDRRDPENRFTRRDNRPPRDGEERKERKFGDRRERKFGEDRKERKFDDRRERRFGDDRKDRKFGDRRGSRDEGRQERQQPESDNPLAVRRNPSALRMLQNKQPSLPADTAETIESVVMRKRGWHKKED